MAECVRRMRAVGPVTCATGATRSSVHVRDAVTPPRVARTVSVCRPSGRPDRSTGDAHAPTGLPSTLHSTAPTSGTRWKATALSEEALPSAGPPSKTTPGRAPTAPGALSCPLVTTLPVRPESGVTDPRIAAAICATVAVGASAHSIAATPLTWGAAVEVPDFWAAAPGHGGRDEVARGGQVDAARPEVRA